MRSPTPSRQRRWAGAPTLLLLALPCCSLLAPDAEGIVGQRDASVADSGLGGTGNAGAGGSSGANTGGSSGGGPDCGAATSANYEIRRVPADSPVSIDGKCDDAAWLSATVMKFEGPTTTNNTASCRLLWDPSGSPRMFGCCTVQDTDVRGSVTVHDGDVFNDDSVEYYLRPGDEAALGPGTVKLFVNVLGTTQDAAFPGYDKSYEANMVTGVSIAGTLNDTVVDTSYEVEWSSKLSTQALTVPNFRCAFAVNDKDALPDAGVVQRSMLSFPASTNLINVPTNWGSCYFSCLESGQ